MASRKDTVYEGYVVNSSYIKYTSDAFVWLYHNACEYSQKYIGANMALK